MNVVRLFPNWRYLFKLLLSGILAFFPINVFLIYIGLRAVVEVNIPDYTVMAPVVLVPLFFAGIYLHFRSIRYEIHDDEIIVYSGFINKSVKHVNFRNITNMELKRTFLDRLLGIGSLSIQTAGSGSAIPEEKLAGLDNVQRVYEYLADQLREYRDEPRPNSNIGNMVSDRQIAMQMLRELRAIRTLLSQ